MMNKQFLSVRSLATLPSGKQKKCKDCDQPATKEAIFDVGNGISVLERYCEPCLGVMLKETGSLA
jgi:MinD superfamily P-loop ATPase